MTPDLNPTDHVWYQMKQRLDDRILPPTDLAELLVASEQRHEASEEDKTLQSRCRCNKWWKYPLLARSTFVYQGLSLVLS